MGVGWVGGWEGGRGLQLNGAHPHLLLAHVEQAAFQHKAKHISMHHGGEKAQGAFILLPHIELAMHQPELKAS